MDQTLLSMSRETVDMDKINHDDDDDDSSKSREQKKTFYPRLFLFSPSYNNDIYTTSIRTSHLFVGIILYIIPVCALLSLKPAQWKLVSSTVHQRMDRAYFLSAADILNRCCWTLLSFYFRSLVGQKYPPVMNQFVWRSHALTIVYVYLWISVVISNRPCSVLLVKIFWRYTRHCLAFQNGMTDGPGPVVTICVVRHDHRPIYIRGD